MQSFPGLFFCAYNIDMDTDQKKQRGRPRTVGPGGGRARNVYLDDESVAIAIKLGRGSLSRGLRFALRAALAHEKHNS